MAKILLIITLITLSATQMTYATTQFSAFLEGKKQCLDLSQGFRRTDSNEMDKVDTFLLNCQNRVVSNIKLSKGISNIPFFVSVCSDKSVYFQDSTEGCYLKAFVSTENHEHFFKVNRKCKQSEDSYKHCMMENL